MKLLKKGILSLFGTLLLIVTLSACNTDNIPENRTKGEYNVENSFQPVFDFLAEDPKDFSNVESYSSRLSVVDNATGNRMAVSTLSLNNSNNIVSGEYTVTKNEEEIIYPVILLDGIRQFQGEKPQEDFSEILFQTVPESEFRKLDVTDVMAEHPETEMKTITYLPSKDHIIFKKLIAYYHLVNIVATDVSLGWHSSNNFTFQFSVNTDQESYILTQNITFIE